MPPPIPGPPALGRGVVVAPGAHPPAAWAGAERVVVGDSTLADPRAAVSALHRAWAERRPVVVDLGVDPADLRVPQSWTVEPWTLGAEFEPWLDRLHFLVWANTYDARDGPPVWWWARKAERAGARPSPEGPADVQLPDGRPAWIDGGPRAPLDPEALGAAVVHSESVELGRLTVATLPPAPTTDLAPDQLEAVTHRSGPARIIAPAGSGKTRVLTERLRHLVVDMGYEQQTVLAVAYNKKAQEELEQRCVTFRPRARTLNSLGHALLTEARGHAQRVLDERDTRRIVEELVPRPRRRVNTDPTAPYLEALSLARLGLRDPAAVEDERDDVPGLALAFGPYRRRLAEAGAVDFDEQVYGAIEALLADGAFRRRAQAGCRHLLVDEFQDLTPAHVLLLRLLAAPGLDVFGVGDDDQVIYGHAGADPRFLLDFEALFPWAGDHRLEVNYRCPAVVVESATNLLSYNHRRVAKDVRPGPGAEPGAHALQVRRHASDAGATDLAELVAGWLAEPGAAPAGVAVLARVNALLLAPHVALSEAGVPLDSVLRTDVLDRTGVRAALAYLRIGADPHRMSGADVAEVYRRPSRGFPQWFPKWLRGRLSIDGLRAIGARIDDPKVSAKVDDLADDLEIVAKAMEGGTTRHALSVVKDRIGLGGAMGMLDGSASREGGSSHLDDLEALEQVAGLHPDPATFETWLRRSFRREATPGGVTLSTIHRVKGREWDRVALFAVTAGILPHRLSSDEEEERRVLHVGLTRGRQRVAVLTDASRPSPFLAELTGAAPHRPARSPEDVSARRADRAPRPATTAEPAPGVARAEEALRAWRLERCRRDKVSAFIVLYDRHLRAIAIARPRTLQELRRLEGIGPTKLELYGEEILAVLEGLDT